MECERCDKWIECESTNYYVLNDIDDSRVAENVKSRFFCSIQCVFEWTRKERNS